jgi:hypothetical protein
MPDALPWPDPEPDDAPWNPWEEPEPPQWPAGILPKETEETSALLNLRHGIDMGVIAMTVLAGVAAAAPKNARFIPYQGDELWRVPPIIWLMLIGESGMRKSLLDAIGFAAVRNAHAAVWGPYMQELRRWKALSTKDKHNTSKPSQPHGFIADDTTPEALQIVLAGSDRGTALVKDELAGFLEFSRYRNSGGEAARAFYLSCYDDAPCPVNRIDRGSEYIQHTGLSIFGGIQPTRLGEFKRGMESDGLLQRLLPVHMLTPAITRNDVKVIGLDKIEAAIARVCVLDGQEYTTTPEGSERIRKSECYGADYAKISDYSEGWPGFCRKLHGTHARLALLLHLFQPPVAENIISEETVYLAGRLLHEFLLPHARDFYASLPGSNRNTIRDIAGWLLTKDDATTGVPERILASDLARNVASCRPLGSKGLNELLDQFILNDWLKPEHEFPNNRVWSFSPAIRAGFIKRAQDERARRADIRAKINRVKQSDWAEV